MVDIDENLPYELVDAFFMDIEPSLVAAGGGMTEVISLPGLYMIANIGLSFEVDWICWGVLCACLQHRSLQ